MSNQRHPRVPRKRRSSEPPPTVERRAAPADEPGMLLVISGPSGVGKDTVWQEASGCLPSFNKTITCTTRPQRPGEEPGVTYFFVSDDEFDSLVEEDELLEWAEVHGNRYGVPAALVLQRLEQGLDVVCVIDVQGARRIRSLFMTRALLIFIKPPENREAHEVLKERIQARGGENEQEMSRRLETATWELTQTELFDHEIENSDVSRAAQEICKLVEREKAGRV